MPASLTHEPTHARPDPPGLAAVFSNGAAAKVTPPVRLRRALWQRLRHHPDIQGIPPGYREDLAREVYWITLQRARIFALVALTINLILFYAHDYMIYMDGVWASNPFYLKGFLWRVVVTAGFGLYLVTYALVRPQTPSDVRLIHRVLATGYVAFALASGTSLSILQQGFVMDVSIFTLCLLCVAALFHLPNKIRWGLYLVSLGVLILGIRYLIADDEIWANLSTNALSVVVIGFFLERIAYGYQIRNFIDTRVIQDKHERLGAALDELRMTQAQLEAEHAHKTKELEEARLLQLAMLPQHMPQHPAFDLAAYTRPAMEVGGDYYDFDVADNGTLTLAIGDATGHGARAGAMVTATKILFTSLTDEADIEYMLRRATDTLKRIGLPRLYMALALGRLQGHILELVGAGMPPALIHRAATGSIELVPLKGMPLGSFTSFPYQKQRVELAPGDTVLLMSDGFPELFDGQGTMLGYDEVIYLFEQAIGGSAQDIVNRLVDATQRWSGDAAVRDDVTLVALKMRPVLPLSIITAEPPGDH